MQTDKAQITIDTRTAVQTAVISAMLQQFPEMRKRIIAHLVNQWLDEVTEELERYGLYVVDAEDFREGF